MSLHKEKMTEQGGLCILSGTALFHSFPLAASGNLLFPCPISSIPFPRYNLPPLRKYYLPYQNTHRGGFVYESNRNRPAYRRPPPRGPEEREAGKADRPTSDQRERGARSGGSRPGAGPEPGRRERDRSGAASGGRGHSCPRGFPTRGGRAPLKPSWRDPGGIDQNHDRSAPRRPGYRNPRFPSTIPPVSYTIPSVSSTERLF